MKSISNKKSGQEVAKVLKDKSDKPKLAKTDSRYWLARLFRNKYGNGEQAGQTKDWCVRVARAGRRETINLQTPNRDVAARKAQECYQSLLSKGWDETLAVFKPKAAKPVHIATVGEFLSQVRATTDFRDSTFTVYSQSLRKIVADIAEIDDQPAIDENGQPKRDRRKRIILLSRRDHRSGGRDAWVSKVEAQSLDILTPDAIQRWKLAYIALAGTAPDAHRRATNTSAALLRSARALFSERAIKFVKDTLTLPAPLPFSDLKLPKTTGTRYVSRIDAGSLIAAARSNLTGEPFKVFCLALLCGLRKREIDTLLWRQVDFQAAQIRIEATEYFQPKSEDSIGSIDLDDELIALLRGWKASSTGEFVVAEELQPHTNRARSNYRCSPVFRALYDWLAIQGVTARKPLHELRKELGAILASEQGIFAAQSVLRHAQISTTAAYYVDKKRRITAGLGSFLSAEGQNIISADFVAEEPQSKKKDKLSAKAQ